MSQFLLSRHPETFGAVNTIEGFDVVGEVACVGPDTPNFVVGEKVVTFTRGIGPRTFTCMIHGAFG
jgi:NADPH:quinone reductase-like Zn-dependent oxidoreductase